MKRIILSPANGKIVLAELRGKTITETCDNLEPKKAEKGSDERKNEVQSVVKKDIKIPVVVTSTTISSKEFDGTTSEWCRITFQNRFRKVVEDACKAHKLYCKVRRAQYEKINNRNSKKKIFSTKNVAKRLKQNLLSSNH